MERPTKVRILPDYDCHATWVQYGDGEIFDNTDPHDLPLSPDLAADLDRWADAYDAVLDRDDPAASDFESPRAAEDFARRGALLARRVKEELGGGVPVDYFDIRTSRDVPVE